MERECGCDRDRDMDVNFIRCDWWFWLKLQLHSEVKFYPHSILYHLSFLLIPLNPTLCVYWSEVLPSSKNFKSVHETENFTRRVNTKFEWR